MLTTQIGSLPFNDVNVAIDYAIQFDLPFIPTLPKLSSSEMMLALALDGYSNMDLSIKECCLASMLDKHRPSICKYQILGPVSAMYMNPSQLDTGKLAEYLIQKIIKVKKLFQSFGCKMVIFLDEPCLEFVDKKYNQLLVSFIDTLSGYCPEIGIHCCSNADWEFLNDLPLHFLSFDYFRYHEVIDSLLNKLENKKLCYGFYPTRPVIKPDDYNNWLVILKKISNLKSTSHYITPSCGLGMSSLNTVKKAINLKCLL